MYILQEHSKPAIKFLFNSLLSNQLPYVLFLASCWSFQSELSNIIRASGLLSALNISEERGKITIGNMLQLDKYQQEVLRTIINDETIKDVCFQGMNLKWQCTQKNILVQTFGRECTVKEWVSKKANWTSLIVYIPPFANFFGIIDGNQLQIIDPKIPFRRYICHLFTFFILIW